MLEDTTSLNRLCRMLVSDYIAPLMITPPPSRPAQYPACAAGLASTPPASWRHTRACSVHMERGGGSRAARRRAACSHLPPPPRLCHAFLWGCGSTHSRCSRRSRESLEDLLRGVAPARPCFCCRAAEARAKCAQAHGLEPAAAMEILRARVGRSAAVPRRVAVWKVCYTQGAISLNLRYNLILNQDVP